MAGGELEGAGGVRSSWKEQVESEVRSRQAGAGRGVLPVTRLLWQTRMLVCAGHMCPRMHTSCTRICCCGPPWRCRWGTARSRRCRSWGPPCRPGWPACIWVGLCTSNARSVRCAWASARGATRAAREPQRAGGPQQVVLHAWQAAHPGLTSRSAWTAAWGCGRSSGGRPAGPSGTATRQLNSLEASVNGALGR